LKNTINKIFRLPVWLIAINLCFILILFLKYIDFRYEYAVYRNLASSQIVYKNEPETFKNLVELTYRLQADRLEIMQNMRGMQPFKSRWFRSGDLQLLDANGSCGNFAHILAELCKTAGMPVRMVQLMQNGRYGAHIIIEAKVNGRWAAADGLFKTYFLNPDSSLANLDDIKNHLDYFDNQFPDNYPYKDAFVEYRYTNWDKIPVVMPVLKVFLTAFKGEAWVKTFSMRSYLLNLHKALFYIILWLYLPILVISAYQFWLFLKFNLIDRKKVTSDERK